MTDFHAAQELTLYIDNDGDLYRRLTTSILKNLVTKRARGEYDHNLAVKAFGYLAEAGAKKYAAEFGSSGQAWDKMFDVGTRKRAAEELTRDFETEAALGNYDQLLPKKYQGQKSSGGQHARRRQSRMSARESSSGLSARDAREFRGFLQSASDSQVGGIYEKEKRGGRDEYAALARAEADRRGISLDGGYNHARRKTRAELAQDIRQVLGKRGYRS